MAPKPTTGLQVSGHRFVARRMAHAMVRGEVGMLDDPLRAQSLSLTAGCALAVIAVAVCAILAYLQPHGVIGGAQVVMIRDSGALYVRIGDVVRPVFNLASARLITGATTKPELISASALDNVQRGAAVGIPGAPDSIGPPLAGAESGWTVCEDMNGTTLVIGRSPEHLDTHRSALVTVRGESAAATYLLFDGRRARVDLRNPAVVRVLKLDGRVPRQVSRALLDALPESPEIRAPVVPRAGEPSSVHGFDVGTVFRLDRGGEGEYYVALVDGVQRIGALAADLIRFTQIRGQRGIVSIAPGVIGNAPVVDYLPVAFPDRADLADDPALCARWSWADASKMPDTAVLSGDPPTMGPAVDLAQADGSGPRIDRVVLPSGRNAFVRAAGVSGQGAATGALNLVGDTGVLFGIRNGEAANRMGLTNPVPAPWPVLAHLPAGPELSIEAASIQRDSVGLSSPPPR